MRTLTITFGQSKSANLNKAIKLAKSLSGYSSSGNTHSISIPAANLEASLPGVESILGIVGDWKSTHLIIDGKEVSAKAIAPLKCYAEYCLAIIQDIHCKRTKDHPGWSCKHLLEIERHSCLSSYPWDNRFWWFQVGQFITSTVWEIDKEKITEILKREVQQKRLDLCPKFSWNKVQIHIDNLPASIDLSTNDLWEVEYLHEPGFPPKPYRVKPKIEEADSSLEYNDD